jgi:hypothetical protein
VANLEPIKLNNAEGYFQRRMNRLLQNTSASSTKSHIGCGSSGGRLSRE